MVDAVAIVLNQDTGKIRLPRHGTQGFKKVRINRFPACHRAFQYKQLRITPVFIDLNILKIKVNTGKLPETFQLHLLMSAQHNAYRCLGC